MAQKVRLELEMLHPKPHPLTKGDLKRRLAPCRVRVSLPGTVQQGNALMRAFTDETPGLRLQALAEEGGRDVGPGPRDDPYMIREYVAARLNQVRLRPLPWAEVEPLEWRLLVENRSQEPLEVTTGDLEPTGPRPEHQLFNPDIVIARVGPGRRLWVKKIRVLRGTGRECATFAAAVQGSLREEGPGRVLVGAVVPAVSEAAEAAQVLRQAVEGLQVRLRAAAAVEAAVSPDGELRLVLPGETATVGSMLRRQLHDLAPGATFIGVRSAVQQDQLELTVRGGEPLLRLRQALKSLQDRLAGWLTGLR